MQLGTEGLIAADEGSGPLPRGGRAKLTPPAYIGPVGEPGSGTVRDGTYYLKLNVLASEEWLRSNSNTGDRVRLRATFRTLGSEGAKRSGVNDYIVITSRRKLVTEGSI